MNVTIGSVSSQMCQGNPPSAELADCSAFITFRKAGELLGSHPAGSADSHLCGFIKEGGISIICGPSSGVSSHLLALASLFLLFGRKDEKMIAFKVVSHQLLSMTFMMRK